MFDKKILVGVICVLATTFVYGNDIFSKTLRKDALSAGLMAIPTDKNKLEEIIKQHTPNYSKYPTTKERVELGKKLFFDPRLSKSGIISCNTCHNLGLGGVDGIPASTGHKWTPNPKHINAPTVYNSVFNLVQFWDGRAVHLQDQAKGPIQDLAEMAADPKVVEEKINSIPEYIEEFKHAYGNNIVVSFDLIATSIGIFERTLITPSRYDKFLLGDNKALSDEEQKGFRIFLDKGCASCHTGINLGGKMSVFELASRYKYADVGSFKGDKGGMIKSPTLRNIELTAPYFHNGAIWDLEEAITNMGKIQLGINIKPSEAKQIAIFLRSLTGKMPEISYPMLPPSRPSTPKPDLEYNNTN